MGKRPRRMRSTFSRIFSNTAIMLLLSFLVMGTAFAGLSYHTNFKGRTDTLSVSATEVAAMTAPFASGGKIQANRSLAGYLNLAAGVSGNHIIVCDSSGRVLVSSDSESEMANILAVSDEIIGRVMLNGEYIGVGNLGGLYLTSYLSVGEPVVSAYGDTVGAVFVSTEVSDISSMIMQFVRIFVSVGVLVIAASCVWAFYYTRRITRPLGRIAEASREFARGNLNVRVDENVGDTEVHELAVSFNNMAESLEKSEERRREFIANISHELKTPMTSIGGYVDGILDGVLPAEKQESYLRIVSSETRRLSRLVSEMLEISRVEAQQGAEERMEIFDLCELARQVLLSREQKITDRGLDVDVRFDEAIRVVANTDGITRVIYNLLDNAIKYSDEGTVVTLDIVKLGSKAVFSVSDIGTPISPEERDRIFDRFHKADRSRRAEGLGLGLYLVKQIMARHNEDVWCETDGKRTTMRFTLPLAE